MSVSAPTWATATLSRALTPDSEMTEHLDTVDATVAVQRTEHGWRVTGDFGSPWQQDGNEAATRAAASLRLASEVHLAIAALTPGFAFIHAGAVEWRNVGVVIPGSSRAGKSTLVQALLLQGASYLSDEYAVLDDQGRVHPYTKPLSIRGATTTGTELVPPERFGSVASRPVPVAAVVHTHHVADATWSPQHVSGAQVVLPLVANAVAARLAPSVVTTNTVAVATAGAILLDGERGEADTCARAILTFVDDLIIGKHQPNI